jgi:hypothetical protein
VILSEVRLQHKISHDDCFIFNRKILLTEKIDWTYLFLFNTFLSWASNSTNTNLFWVEYASKRIRTKIYYNRYLTPVQDF